MTSKEEILKEVEVINAEQEEFKKYRYSTNLNSNGRTNGNVNCNYLIECYNCENCKDCFKCSDIKDSEYKIENIQFTKEEYIQFFKALEFNSKYKKELSLFRSRLYNRGNYTYNCELWFNNRPNVNGLFDVKKWNDEHIKDHKEFTRKCNWNLFVAFCIIISVSVFIVTVLDHFVK